MTHGSLFSGIGGFDLAASMVGWSNVFNCEIDRFCRRILLHYWPKARSYEDIKGFSAIEYRGLVDVLSGGFPCQPFSQAGQRRGVEDKRYLWPEMLRIIGEVQPRWVVGENVPGLLNWNRGLVFRTVLGDLESAGYEVWPYIIPACGVGAPHRRDRVWFIAHANSHGRLRHKESSEGNNTRFPEGMEEGDELDPLHGRGSATKSRGKADQGEGFGEDKGLSSALLKCLRRWDYKASWRNFPTQSPVCGRDDGLPTGLDGVSFSAWRKDSLKGYGNAIVPQVAAQLFKAIEAFEYLDGKR